MDGFEYEIGLKDNLSGKLDRPRDALGRFTKGLGESGAALKRADDAFGTFFGKFGGTYATQAEKGAAALEHVAKAAKSAHGGAHTFASGISYAVRGFDDLARGGRYAANGILDVGQAFRRLGPFLAGAAVLGVTAAIAHASLEMSEFREQTVAAFDVLQGEGNGRKTFDLATDLAASVHAPTERVAQETQKLLELGLKGNAQLSQTVRAVEDLRRAGLEEGSRKLESIVERSLAAGHLVLGRGGAGASRALTGTAVTEEELAKQLGLSPKALEAALKSGKITVEEGIAALDQAIIQGKVGALATKKFTVSDAFQDLHNSVRKLLQESDDSPISDAMRRLTESFADGTDGARELSDVVDGIFKGVGLAIDGVRDLGRVFGETADYVLDTWDKVDDVIAGIGKSQAEKDQIATQRRIANHKRALAEAIDDQSRAFGKVQNLATSGASKAEIMATAKRLGIEVDVLAGGKLGKHERTMSNVEISRGDKGHQFVVDRNTAVFSNPYGALRDAQRAGTIGASGLHTTNVDALEDAGEKAGDGLKQGVEKKLKIHSPSQVMHDLGVHAAEGLISGTQQAAAPVTNVGGKSVTVHVDMGGFALHGSIDADELMPLLESQIADVFERVAEEMG